VSFQIHEQYIDEESGMHVIHLRDGKKRHVLQIAIGHDSCPACGAVHPKTNLGDIDPRQAAETASAALDESQKNIAEYAEKHRIPIR
jgi:hypothetical protein